MSLSATRAEVHVESAGDGPPLVLLHGWALHGGLFGPLVAAYAPRFRVHAVDLPGHGHSAAVRADSLDQVVDAVASSVADGEPLTVIGWSFGGQVALRWAARDPARIARLVLVATSPRFVAAADWPHAMTAETLARFGDELSAAYRPTLMRFLSLQAQGSDEGRRTLSVLRHGLFARGDPPRAAIAAALRLLATTDLRDEVRSVRASALVVSGERDTLAPAAAGAWLAQAMPHARYACLEGAAHAPFLSHRTAFDAAVGAFFDEP